MLFIGLVIFFINKKYLRFADEQSIIMPLVSLFAFYTIQNYSIYSLIVLWVVVNLLPVFFSINNSFSDFRLTNVKIYKPFDHSIRRL